MFGFRNKLKSVVKNVFGVEEETQESVNWSSKNETVENEPEVNKTEEKEEISIPLEEVQEEAEDIKQPDIPEVIEGGLELTVENLEEILDDFVRPGLQADGGDITLVKIEGNDIYVQLMGACQTCSSAVMTMRMGVEALLREEFPQMGELFDITHS